MRRRHVHALFAALAAGCALLAALHEVRLVRAVQVNKAVAQASAASAAVADDAPPEARLARALALARAGRSDEALTIYKSLAHGDREDLKRAALYNLGNLHLREAMQLDPANKTRSVPLVELAKQSYRDLLRDDAHDWDARYNLERALWLAPEQEEDSEDLAPPQQSERAITTMKSDRGGLP
jgi:mxaK protein